MRSALRLQSIPALTKSVRPPASLRRGFASSSAPGPNPPNNNNNNFRNGLLAAACLVGAGVAYYYPSLAGGTAGASQASSTGGSTFKTAIRTRNGVMEHIHTLLSADDAEKLMHGKEISVEFNNAAVKPSSVSRYATNTLASNDPIEDRYAADSISRQLLYEGIPKAPADKIQGDGLKLFSVIDGHGGWATSQLLSQTLHPMLVLSLRSLHAGNTPEAGLTSSKSATDFIKTSLQRMLPSAAASLLTSPATVSPQTISDAITSAYLALDDQIVSSPLRLIGHVPSQPGKPNVRPIVLPLIEPATNGAVAVSMVVDEDRGEFYVASTGDCRAVAGYWVEGKDGRPSGWRCEVLTEDCMGENPKEIKRMQAEHPANERDQVIMRGRVMGGLQPTRAFGDAPNYKWKNEDAAKIQQMVPEDHPFRNKRLNGNNRTPPYVTARPEVTYRKISNDPLSDEGQLRFVVLATDGIWDSLTSSEAVALVAAHSQQPIRKPTFQQAVNALVRYQSEESRARYPGPDAPTPNKLRTLDWVFEDENPATHLIRNAMVGAKTNKSVHELLSIKAPTSRWLRDDMTCTIVFFGGSSPSTTSPSNPIAAATGGQQVRAKL